MGRVETRMYRRRQKRASRIRWGVVLLLAAGAALLLWRGGQASFGMENLDAPSSPPGNERFDKTVETREVTLPEETWYAIQTGVFSTREAAVEKADAYTQRGAPGTVVRQGEKWRVFIACYGTDGEATVVRTRLETNQKVDTYLYTWVCPQLRLRLTGMVGQLDAVEAGFTLLTSTASALRDTAVALDAAQLSTQEVDAMVEELDGQVSLWEDTVKSRFGKSIPPMVGDMLSITANWDARCSNLRAAGDATALSAALKAEAMGIFDEICTWREKLAAQ